MRGVIALIRRDDRILLIQRSEHVRVPLAWCFPGGEMEPGESQPDALIREVREELNVEIRPGELLMTQTKHDGRLVLYCWSAALVAGEPEPNPKEVARCAWLTPAEIRAMAGVLPGTAEILAHAGL